MVGGNDVINPTSVDYEIDVFKVSEGSNKFVPYGSPIIVNGKKLHGKSVSLSGDGSTIAYTTGGDEIHTVQYKDSDWRQHGSVIGPFEDVDHLTVALSDNADTLAILEEAHSVIAGQTKSSIPDVPDALKQQMVEKKTDIFI